MFDTDEMAAFQLGAFSVIPDRNVIRHGDEEHRLEPKVMGVLCMLANAGGTVVSRSDLIDAVWGVEHGADESLTRAISLLRAVFRHQDQGARLIETVPRKGYRLSESVQYEEVVSDLTGRQILEPPILHEANADAAQRIDQKAASDGQRFARHPAILVIVICFALVGGFLVTNLLTEGSQPDEAFGDASIAVLPFEDLSSDGDKDYFAVGVSDEIRTTLNQLSGVRVVGRSSSLAAAADNATARETGSTLGVSYLLDGSVRWSGSRALITSELVNVADGSIVWSRSYDRNMTAEDLVSIQSDIAGEVAGALSVAFDLDLDLRTRSRMEGLGTRNLTAYDLYLQARMGRMRMPSGDAIVLLRRAVEEDPNYGAAWSLMGIRTGGLQWRARSAAEARTYFEEALSLTRRGVELDPESAEARSYYGGMLVGTKDFSASEEQHQVALSLGANSASLVQYTRLLQRTGRISVALVPAKRAQQLEPVTQFLDLEAELKRQAQNYAAARTTLEGATRGDYTVFSDAFERWLIEANAEPNSDQTWSYLSEVRDLATTEAGIVLDIFLENRGNDEAVRVALRREFERSGDQYPEKNLHIAIFAALANDPALALEALSEEISRSTVRMTYLWEELFSDMRKLPDFKSFARANGLEVYWREYGWADQCRPLSETDFECY